MGDFGREKNGVQRLVAMLHVTVADCLDPWPWEE
jgi:hypothetical protein